MLKNSLIFVSGMVTGVVALIGGVAIAAARMEKKRRENPVAESVDAEIYEPF